jgi:oxygen-independent coproporphyrinogen-3 oxidase
LEALEREVAAVDPDSVGPFDTLYLGGGTPSVLAPKELGALMEAALSLPLVSDGAEVTLEANPDDVTADLLECWRDQGVNRLSLGVQSFDDDALRQLGRRHDGRQALAACELARAAGFSDVGLDLIFGRPGQSLPAWRADLEQAAALEPEHLSCYQLTFELGTPFGRRLRRGDLTEPDEETGRAMFLLTHRFLTARGYEHYEISNYGRPGFRSRHNQKYWSHTPYLGLGPSAHSHAGNRRSWNPSGLTDYVAGVQPQAEWLSEEQLRLETLMLGLRTSDGVARDFFDAGPASWQTTLADLNKEGLLEVGAERVRPTTAGMLLADGLPLRF